MAVICYTADTHSYMYPTDYVKKEKLPMGYIHLSSLFDEDAILIDGGDVLQGSPIIRYEIKNGLRPFFSALCYKAAGLDVFVPGNHDFNFGYDILKDFTSEIGCDFVCANLIDLKGDLNCKPYVVKTAKDGVRIFITGVVTDYVNVWEDKKNLEHIRITDSVDAAQKMLQSAKAEKSDYTVLVYHGGFGDEGFSGAEYVENRGGELSKLGYDVLLQAHQHSVIKPYMVDGTLSLQVGAKALKGARIEFGSRKKTIHASFFDVDLSIPLKRDMRMVVKNDPVYAGVEEYLSKEVGRTSKVFRDEGKLESAVNGCPLADFINDVQLRLTGADVSAASLPNDPVSIGPVVTISDVLALYPFSNTLVKFRMKASELKTAMERTASYFSISESGRIEISESFIHPKAEHYNYDYYRGISYAFDISRPVGDRVVKMVFKGIDLLRDPEHVLSVCVNSYRASGTGGYGIYGRVSPEKRYGKDMQDVLLEIFEKGESIAVPEKTDFKVFPEFVPCRLEKNNRVEK